ncbi:hypothetical protein CsatB_025047 [Cannabis sativa]
MEKLILFSLIISNIFIGLTLASSNHWSILSPKFKNGLINDSLKRYCESWRINVEVKNIMGFEVVPQECVEYIQQYMTSSQYKADSEMALEEVKLYLSGSCTTLENDGKDAWIFDVDDTMISTIPYYKRHGFGGEKRNTTSLETWMKKRKAPALKHTLNIFHDIKDKGLKIFLISSRSESLRSHTVDNLVSVGYHGWTKLSLRGLEDEQLDAKEYKSKTRQRLVDEGYRIWGIVGDQWSSLEGYPSAKRTFKLPNSIYYLS